MKGNRTTRDNTNNQLFFFQPILKTLLLDFGDSIACLNETWSCVPFPLRPMEHFFFSYFYPLQFWFSFPFIPSEIFISFTFYSSVTGVTVESVSKVYPREFEMAVIASLVIAASLCNSLMQIIFCRGKTR